MGQPIDLFALNNEGPKPLRPLGALGPDELAPPEEPGPAPIDLFGLNQPVPGARQSSGGLGTEAGLEKKQAQLEQLAKEKGILPTIKDDLVGGVQHVADFLSRPMYAVEGAIDEAVKGNYAGIPGRAASEFFSGLPWVKGQHKDFSQVLQDAGMSDKAGLPVNIGGKDFGRITLRGAAGLALDIALDPTTYLTLGANHWVHVAETGGKVLGKLALSEEGLAEAAKISSQLLENGVVKDSNVGQRLSRMLEGNFQPETIERAEQLAQGKPVDLPSDPFQARKWLDQAAEYQSYRTQAAYEEAHAILADRVAQGETSLRDLGGIKMFGQTIVPGDYFGRPITTTAKKLSKIAYEGDGMLSNMLKFGFKLGDEISNAFNQLSNAARGIPGLQNFFTGKMDQLHNSLRMVGNQLDAMLPDELKKVVVNASDLKTPFARADMPITEYILHALDNPKAYPVDRIPADYMNIYQNTKTMLAEVFAKEMDMGRMPAEREWKAYMTHIYKNSPEQMDQMLERMRTGMGSGFNQGFFGSGIFDKTRRFETLDQAAEIAGQLKARGQIGFDLRPDLDLKSVLAKRMEAHYSLVASDDFVKNLKRAYGLSPEQVGKDIADRAMPGLYHMLENVTKAQPVEAKALEGLPAAELRTSHLPAIGSAVQETDQARAWARPDVPFHADSDFVRETLTDAGHGDPGLSGWEPTNGEKHDTKLVYRDPQGNPVGALFLAQNADGTSHVASFAVDKSRGVLAGRAAVAIAAEAKKIGIEHYGSMSKDAINFVTQAEKRLGPALEKKKAMEILDTVRKDSGIPVDPESAAYRKARGESLNWYRGQDPTVQAAFLHGRMRTASSWKEVDLLWHDFGPELAKWAPEDMRDAEKLINDATFSAINPRQAGKPIPPGHPGYWAQPIVAPDKLRDGTANPFAGFVMPRTVVDEVTRLSQALVNTRQVSTILKTYDMVNDLFKVGVTVYFPAFHFRNAYSNVFSNFISLGLQGMNPVSYIKAAAIALEHDGTLHLPGGGRMTYDEVRALAQHYGVVKDFSDILQLTRSDVSPMRQIVQGGPLMEQVPKPLRTIMKPGQAVTRTAAGIGGGIENNARLQLFISHLERGMGPMEAATEVKKFLFDYGQMTPFEQNVMKRLVPFYTWNKKNISLTAREMLRQPGKYAGVFKLAGPGDDGPEADALPYYLKGALKIKLQKGPGNAVFINGIDLPPNSAINQIFNGDVLETIRQNAGQIAPALKTPLELGAHIDLFTGKDLRDRAQVNSFGKLMYDMPFDKPIRDWLEMSKETNPKTGDVEYKMNGTKAYLMFRAYAYSRMLNSFDKLTKDDPSMQAAVLNIVTGLSGKEIDLSQDEKMLLRRRVNQLEQQLIKRGVLRPSNDTYVAKGVQL